MSLEPPKTKVECNRLLEVPATTPHIIKIDDPILYFLDEDNRVMKVVKTLVEPFQYCKMEATFKEEEHFNG